MYRRRFNALAPTERRCKGFERLNLSEHESGPIRVKTPLILPVVHRSVRLDDLDATTFTSVVERCSIFGRFGVVRDLGDLWGRSEQVGRAAKPFRLWLLVLLIGFGICIR